MFGFTHLSEILELKSVKSNFPFFFHRGPSGLGTPVEKGVRFSVMLPLVLVPIYDQHSPNL